jgi:hypothetical protein
MKLYTPRFGFSRRDFLKSVSVLGIGAVSIPFLSGKARGQEAQKTTPPPKPGTNVADAAKHPRTTLSIPGKYAGKVVEVNHPASVAERKIDITAVEKMVTEGMLTLTGAASIHDAWRQFVSPKDRIGLKVNPVAGKELSTSIEVTKVIIGQLVKAGIPEKNILIWDRREMELEETGFTAENFPGIRVKGTECKIDGSFTDKDGKFHSEARIDKDWYYYADVEGKYDAETLPYMINEGKYSYFSKICTQEVDKIINIPILKNAGASVTLCMKNLAYGAISNTGRLHKDLWAETCAEVCAFPPLRDKVVLNIVDGLIGCYQGGPGANPQYITEFKCMLFGSDPVAVDRIGYDIILQKRIAEGIQKEESPKGMRFMTLSSDLGLGVSDKGKIERITKNLS